MFVNFLRTGPRHVEESELKLGAIKRTRITRMIIKSKIMEDVTSCQLFKCVRFLLAVEGDVTQDFSVY